MLINRLIRIVIFAIAIFFVVSLSRSIFSLWQKESIVVEEEKKLGDLKEKHQQLKESFSTTQSQEFIEEKARSSLGLAKEGEYVVVLPPITPVITPSPTPQLDSWQKWWRLFVY